MSKVFIIGGGPSLGGFNFKSLDGHDCITINKSLFNVPNPKYFITIDHSFLNKTKGVRRQIAESSANSFFVSNYAGGTLKDDDGRILCTKTKRHYNLAGFDVIIKSKKHAGIGFDWGDFRNGNCSGYCAMQLAVLLRYDEIYMLGIDLATSGNKTHYHNGYGTRLDKMVSSLDGYFKYFRDGVKVALNNNIKIFSCSSISRLNGIIPFVDSSTVL